MDDDVFQKMLFSDVGEEPDLVVAVFCLVFSRTVDKMPHWASWNFFFSSFIEV